jgi:hypothetical protein
MASLSLKDVLRAVEDLRSDMQGQIDGLKSALAAIEASLSAPLPAAPETPSGHSVPEISSEVLVILAAAATTFLGKKVRVRSANMLQTPYEIVNPWAQHGRVFVQASHNLQRGR